MENALDMLPEEMREVVKPLLEKSSETIAKRDAEIHRLTLTVNLLQEQMRLMKLRMFGPSRETMQAGQAELFEVPEAPAPAAESAVETVTVTRRKIDRSNHPGRNDLPAHLPREVVEIPVPSAERVCPDCGAEKQTIGHETSEQLDVVPAKLFVRETRREVCACKNCQGQVSTAPVPSQPIPKALAAPGLIAQVIVDKYADHLPLNRQEKRFAREGVRLPRRTLCDWIIGVHPLLQRVVDEMKKDVLGGGYIQVDETPVPMRDPDKPSGITKGYLFEYSRPGGPVIFEFQAGRSRAGPVAFLNDFNGVLQHDGYSAYDAFGPPIVHMACMAHVRRKFHEAEKAGDQRPRRVLLLIQGLYRIERRLREKGASPEDRLKMRQKRSVKRMGWLRKRIVKLSHAALPESALGKACAYALGQWSRMETFLNDGRVEIDNNWCENGIRPITLGRKNWLFIGAEHAGPYSAVCMSLMETCRRLGISPFDYLRDILTRLPDHSAHKVAELTPANWLAARNQAKADGTAQPSGSQVK
jgi:transposase